MAGRLPAWTGILAAALAAGALGAWIGHRASRPMEYSPPPGLVEVAIGSRVPDLRLPGLADGQVRSLIPTGRPRLINYWASWCGPCRKEMPVLDAYARQQSATGVELLGIAVDTAADARRFLAEVPVAFPQLQEPVGPRDSSVVLGNRRRVLPFSVLIDADGRLIRRHYGAFADEAAVAAWVDARP